MYRLLIALYLYVILLGIVVAISVGYALCVVIDRTLTLVLLPSPPALPRAIASFQPGDLR